MLCSPVAVKQLSWGFSTSSWAKYHKEWGSASSNGSATQGWGTCVHCVLDEGEVQVWCCSTNMPTDPHVYQCRCTLLGDFFFHQPGVKVCIQRKENFSGCTSWTLWSCKNQCEHFSPLGNAARCTSLALVRQTSAFGLWSCSCCCLLWSGCSWPVSIVEDNVSTTVVPHLAMFE